MKKKNSSDNTWTDKRHCTDEMTTVSKRYGDLKCEAEYLLKHRLYGDGNWRAEGGPRLYSKLKKKISTFLRQILSYLKTRELGSICQFTVTCIFLTKHMYGRTYPVNIQQTFGVNRILWGSLAVWCGFLFFSIREL